MNGNAICDMRCDWCFGELEPCPSAKSGLRCKQCRRTEGSDDAPYSTKNKAETLRKQAEDRK